MKNWIRELLPALLAGWLTGCIHSPPPPKPEAVQSLESHLITLNHSVDPEEARRLSVCAYEYSIQLAREYRVVRPALFHNVLVNVGLKKRGLCYQWAGDLSIRFRQLGLTTLEFHAAVARRNTLREHNGIVVCACGQPFEAGIILDAWRHSGRLYWDYVAQDRYPWRRMPE